MSVRKLNGSIAIGDIPYTTVSDASYDTVAGDNILHVTRTATGTCAIALKDVNKIEGMVIEINDAGGGAATYNITVTPESGTINGVGALVINVSNACYKVYPVGANWFTLGVQGSGGPGGATTIPFMWYLAY